MSELELEIIWEDEHMIELSAGAMNSRFFEYTQYSTSRERLVEIANDINGYPKNLTDSVELGTVRFNRSNHEPSKLSALERYHLVHLIPTLRKGSVNRRHVIWQRRDTEFPINFAHYPHSAR